jgi:predicted  nucleic acid-binding Zn-ribbon protein
VSTKCKRNQLFTAKNLRVTEKRIGDLEQLLKSEEEKTSVMVKKSEEVEAVRKRALELEGRIKEQRKKQAEAQQKIKGV